MIPIASPARLAARRFGFLAANLTLYVGFLACLWHGLPSSGWSVVVILCFAAFLPWNVLGFCNAAIGAVLLVRPRPAPLQAAAIAVRTAIVMTIRNEDPLRALARLRVIKASLDATGQGAAFGYFVLSDTNLPSVASAEEQAVGAWQAEMAEPAALHYRRRAENTGYKAGNVMEFCDHAGRDFDLMVTLDADSLMSGQAILRLVRIMQWRPQIGLVQSLVVGTPAKNLFARAFQFGMRAGMRSNTVGQDWWAGDSGPFWGHNAIIRIAPFREHCRLPVLSGKPPFGGHILSHDQVEAVLMHRAGYEVRLQPVAGGSYEDNPPTIIDFIARQVRWCQGNAQYLRLVGMPGLKTVSRFQLIWAILMFLGLPAWILLMALLPVLGARLAGGSPAWLAGCYWAYLLMYLSAKLVGYGQSLASAKNRARYGGGVKLALGAIAEQLLSFCHDGINSFAVAWFMLALGFGKTTRWNAQARDAHATSWGEAMAAFWPQTLFGVWIHGGLWMMAPGLLPWALPFTAGYLLAVPFAVLTANPRIGAWCARHGWFAVPEEIDPPAELVALKY